MPPVYQPIAPPQRSTAVVRWDLAVDTFITARRESQKFELQKMKLEHDISVGKMEAANAEIRNKILQTNYERDKMINSPEQLARQLRRKTEQEDREDRKTEINDTLNETLAKMSAFKLKSTPEAAEAYLNTANSLTSSKVWSEIDPRQRAMFEDQRVKDAEFVYKTGEDGSGTTFGSLLKKSGDESNPLLSRAEMARQVRFNNLSSKYGPAGAKALLMEEEKQNLKYVHKILAHSTAKDFRMGQAEIAKEGIYDSPGEEVAHGQFLDMATRTEGQGFITRDIGFPEFIKNSMSKLKLKIEDDMSRGASQETKALQGKLFNKMKYAEEYANTVSKMPGVKEGVSGFVGSSLRIPSRIRYANPKYQPLMDEMQQLELMYTEIANTDDESDKAMLQSQFTKRFSKTLAQFVSDPRVSAYAAGVKRSEIEASQGDPAILQRILGAADYGAVAPQGPKLYGDVNGDNTDITITQ